MTPAEEIVTSAARLARRSGYVTVDEGVRLHYVRAGQGPLVVLLHGFPAFSLMWERQVEALAAAGFCVVAPDLRGYGLSDKPRPVATYELRVLVRDVARLIAAFGTGATDSAGHATAAGAVRGGSQSQAADQERTYAAPDRSNTQQEMREQSAAGGSAALSTDQAPVAKIGTDATRDGGGAASTDEHGATTTEERGAATRHEHGAATRHEHGAATSDEPGAATTDGHDAATADEHGGAATDATPMPMGQPNLTSPPNPSTTQPSAAQPGMVGQGRAAAVIGHDWGGIIAYALAMDYPQLLDKLVIINAPHPGTFGPFLLRHPDQMRRSAYMAFFQLSWLPEALIKWRDFALIRHELADERTIEALKRPRALTSALNYYRAMWRGGIPAFRKMQTRIATQTLVIWGDKDRYLRPELAEPDPRLMPNARVIHMPDNRHWVSLEAPDAVNAELVRFLYQHPR